MFYFRSPLRSCHPLTELGQASILCIPEDGTSSSVPFSYGKFEPHNSFINSDHFLFPLNLILIIYHPIGKRLPHLFHQLPFLASSTAS
jgi:hypothetical protein